MKIDIYYDKECPFCKKYAQILSLKQKHEIKIFNARENLAKLKEFKSKGFDINEGVIICLEDKILQGSDAVIFLDKLDKPNKKSYLYDNWFFKKIGYKILKIFRVIVLKIFGKNPNIKFEE